MCIFSIENQCNWHLRLTAVNKEKIKSSSANSELRLSYLASQRAYLLDVGNVQLRVSKVLSMYQTSHYINLSVYVSHK